MSEVYQRVSRNTRGRDIIVGDVHGHFSKLRDALIVIDFNSYEGDRLFFVGDLVDRGPESHRAVDWLGCGVFAVRGNHEQWAIDYTRGEVDERIYAENGGGWFINLPREDQLMIAAYFDTMPYAIELETEHGLVGIVHAECTFKNFADIEHELKAPGKRAKHVAEMLLWGCGRIRTYSTNEVTDVRAVVVGHTPVRNWTSFGNHIYIDTGAWRGGEFTLLDAATLQPARKK